MERQTIMTDSAPTASDSTVAEAAGRREQVPGGQQRVVVGLDGSATSRQALLFAAGEARLPGAVLQVAAAHELVVAAHGSAGGFTMGMELGSLQEGLGRAAEDLVKSAGDTVARLVPGAPLHLRTTKAQGRPSQVLLDPANGATLLVVGARGTGAFSGLMLGSTSTKVVHQVPAARDCRPCRRGRLGRVVTTHLERPAPEATAGALTDDGAGNAGTPGVENSVIELGGAAGVASQHARPIDDCRTAWMKAGRVISTSLLRTHPLSFWARDGNRCCPPGSRAQITGSALGTKVRALLSGLLPGRSLRHMVAMVFVGAVTLTVATPPSRVPSKGRTLAARWPRW